MTTLNVYDDTGRRSQWFRNFISESGPLVCEAELQNWASEYNGSFRYNIHRGRTSLWPHWLDFVNEEDATVFLLRWS